MNRKTKERYKRLLPGFLFRVYHAFRLLLEQLRFALFRARYKGEEIQCPVCNESFTRFVRGGESAPVLGRLHVTSAGVRQNCICPKCRSKERDRFLFLFLLHETNFLHQPISLLHFAPEPSLQWIFANRGTMNYVTADLDPKAADLEVDITNMPFEDESFDLLICNHVLEHVPDDDQAFKEIKRVLVPHGVALLQVPIGLALEHTLEDPAIVTPEDRERVFGQQDHVRIYGKDFADRVEAAGLEVRTFVVGDYFTDELIETHALLPNERLFAVTRP